jgi:hypothetical protein
MIFAVIFPRPRKAFEHGNERRSIALDLQAFDPRRGASEQAHVPSSDIKSIRNQPHERFIRLAIARGRAHPRLEYRLPIRKLLDPFDGIATALRSEPNHNNDPTGHYGPRARCGHADQKTLG